MGQTFPLTARQAELLRFIAGYQEDRAASPSYQEMADAVSHGRKSRVAALMLALEERGYVRQRPGERRAILVLNRPALPRDWAGAPLQFISAADLPAFPPVERTPTVAGRPLQLTHQRGADFANRSHAPASVRSFHAAGAIR